MERGDLGARVAAPRSPAELLAGTALGMRGGCTCATRAAAGESGQLDRAVFMYETAVHYNPGCAEAHNNLGVIYKVGGGPGPRQVWPRQHAVCTGCCPVLAWLTPHVLGRTPPGSQKRENLERAMECYAAALTVKPDFPQVGLGTCRASPVD